MAEAEFSDDDRVLAGELALGLLDGADRAAALRRTLAEPAFATEVEAWRVRLAPLFDEIAEVSPPDGAWNAIAARLGERESGPALRRWRAIAVVAAAIAACLAVLLVWRGAPAPVPAPTLIAQVADKGGTPLLVASYDPGDGTLRVRTSNLPAGTLQPELWVIGGDATPRSLGLVALNGASAFVPSPALRERLNADATFALTLEPRAGAPHAAPTGAILGTARLARL